MRLNGNCNTGGVCCNSYLFSCGLPFLPLYLLEKILKGSFFSLSFSERKLGNAIYFSYLLVCRLMVLSIGNFDCSDLVPRRNGLCAQTYTTPPSCIVHKFGSSSNKTSPSPKPSSPLPHFLVWILKYELTQVVVPSILQFGCPIWFVHILAPRYLCRYYNQGVKKQFDHLKWTGRLQRLAQSL